ncbi:hypothetical protein AAVH_05965, partial [Aphelenchoides avenae]
SMNAQLNSKFRLRNNVSSTKFLLAIVGSHFCVVSLSLLGSLAVRVFIAYDSPHFRVFLELVNLHPWYGLVLAFWLHNQQRFSLFVTKVLPVVSEADVHFKKLAEQWNRTSARIVRRKPL